MKKLAIVSTHPIQYNAPLFQLLASRENLQLKVFYTWEQSAKEVFDPGFGKVRQWDIPLLEGYEYTFVKNTSDNPGSAHFKGIINPTLTAEISNWQPDAILVYGWSFKSHLKVMRFFKGKIAVWFRGDSTLLDESEGINLKKIVRRIFLKFIYKYIDIAFYVGNANKEYFLKHGVRQKQLIFAPHAIDNNRFELDEEEKDLDAINRRIALGIKPDDIVFLFAGKLEAKKDPLILINAFRALSPANTHLVIVGNGVLEGELRRLVTETGSQNIHFIGFQNQTQMPVVYRMADVFVLPSAGPGETWGLAVNEAMACNRPVIVSDKCGCFKDLVDDSTGFVFKAGDKNELIILLNKFVSMGKMGIKKMGLNAGNKIRKFCFGEFAAAIEKQLSK